MDERWDGYLLLAARLLGRGGKRSEGLERFLLGFAALVFVAATVIAWRGLPFSAFTLRTQWGLLAAGLGAVTLWVNAMEFGLSARFLGRRLSRLETLRVSVLGSAANFLPIPGAALIRARALRQHGESTRSALTITAAMGLAWVGTAAALAGILQLVWGGTFWLGWSFVLGSLCAGGAVFGLMKASGSQAGSREVTALWGLETFSVLVSGFRIYAVAQTVGFRVGLVDAVTVSLGAILAHVPGIFPGGLGLRELSAGLFGALAGVPASMGVLMSVLDRAVLYVVMGFAVLILLFAGGGLGTDLADQNGGGKTQ